MARRTPKNRRELLLESYEDRVLCSATAPLNPLLVEKAAGLTSAATVVMDAQPTTAHVAPPVAAAPSSATVSGPASQFTEAQRAALQDVVRDSTSQIWFQENVGQFADGVRYGFKTNFGAMLVFDDHVQIVANQFDRATGEITGTHTVNLTFPDSGAWTIVPGGESGVLGTYQRPDGTALTPKIFKEVTLRDVYGGVDLRLYSAASGLLEFDWLVARAQDYEKIRIAATGQDGIVFNSDGSATLDLRFNDLTMKMPEVYQVIGGKKQFLDAAMVAGKSAGEIRYQISSDLVRDQPLVIDPNVAWSTYFDLNDSTLPFDSYLFAVAVNSTGVYAFGWVKETVTNAAFGGAGGYLEGNAGFAQGTAANQAYIYRLNTAGTNITAWTGTGIATSTGAAVNQTLAEQAADLELFPDGRVLAGYTSGRLQIYSANLTTRSFDGEPVTLDALNSIAIVDNNSFYVGGRVAAAIPIAQVAAANIGPDATFGGTLEGVIVRFSNATATPTANWATYVGGNNAEYFTAIALTPDKTKLVFATTTVVGTTYPALVNAIDSTPGAAGTTELLVGVLTEQVTKPAAFSVFSYLGGSGNEGTLATNTTAAVVTATNTFFYVGGNTVSTDLPGTAGSPQATNGGGTFDAFVSRIPINGSAGLNFRSTYLGGTGEDNIGGIAYDTLADRLLVFGTTNGAFPVLNTTPASNYYQGTAGGGLDIFVATYFGNLTVKDYATYIGGTGNDYLGQTGDLVGQGHVIYSPDTGLTYLATTVHSALPAGVIGTPPGKDKTKSNTTNDSHVVFAFNLNIFDYGDAPASYEGSPANEANDAVNSTLRIGLTGDTEASAASGVTALGDDASNTGSADDEDGIASLNQLNAGDSTYSTTVSVLNNTGAARTLQGWIDFNRNGTFEAGEYASVSVASSAVQQSVTLIWSSLPILSAGQSYLRLRLNDAALTDNAGTATIDERSIGRGNFGEVEDYALTITPQPALSVSNVTTTEGTDAYAVFSVALSSVGTAAVSFNLALANGSATGAGTDYGTGGVGNLQVSTNGGASWADATSATIAAGSTSVLVRTPIVNDTLDENVETFTLTATRTAGNTSNASAVGTGTINDNDPAPSITINDVTRNEAAGTMTFTVSLSTASGLPVSVNYATSDGTASAGTDYTAMSGTVNFAVGVTTQTIVVPILNDAVFENSESFNLNLSGAVNGTITDALGLGTIVDNGTGSGGTDNDTPTYSVGNVNTTEGTDAFAVFAVTLSNQSTTAVTFNLVLANGSATGAGVDYGTGGVGNLQVSTNGGATWVDAASATISPLGTSVLVRTPVVNDTLDENAETFTLTATRTAGTTTNASTVGTATINDDDPPPSITINDVTRNEAAGTMTFTVSLSTASGLPVSVNYATSDGTASAGSDYTTTSGTVNFAAGVTTQTIVVPILNDAVFENSESFNLNLSGAVNGTITDGLGLGTIVDNGTGSGGTDNDTPALSVSNVTTTEGTDAYAVFAVSLSNLSTTAVSANLALANGSATGADYGPGLEVSTDGGASWAASTSATITAGSTSVLVRTPVVNDALDEAVETFTLTATRTAGSTTNASAVGTATINDDDFPPNITINDVTRNEAAGTMTFTVSLSAVSGQAVSVNYATSDGTASAGTDYTAMSGTVNFAVGVTTQTIVVPILNDAVFENSESFNLNLSGAVNGTITDALGIGTIVDNGTGSGGTDNDTPTLSVGNVTTTEGTDAFAVFAVSLSNLSTTPVSVNLALANGSATGADYGPGLEVSTDGGATWTASASATIAAGSTSVLVRTPVVNDALDEAAENFTLTATRTAGATTNASAVGAATINDDDLPPNITINDVTRNEAAGTMTFTVSLSAVSGQPVSVNYATSDGTASAGTDYTAMSGTVNFAAGLTTQTIVVPILNDAVFENSESFNLNLSGAVNGTITDALGLGTIVDNGTGSGGTDNDTPTLSVGNVTTTEGTDAFAVFAVSLSNLSTTPVSVNLALANGSATGADYGPGLEVSTDGGATWAASTSATIAAGSSSVLVRTPVVNDTLDENAETFTLTATRTAGTTTNASAVGTATINDNDPPPTIAVNDVSVNEGAGTVTFTVSLNTASGLPVGVNLALADGTATGADYGPAMEISTDGGTTWTPGSSATFAPGATTVLVRTTIAEDALDEAAETFTLTATRSSGSTSNAVATGTATIIDNDPTPTFTINDVTVNEAAGTMTFTVNLSAVSGQATSVDYATVDGTAVAGADFGAASGTLNFAAGVTSQPITVAVLNDAIFENSESFNVVLSAPVNAALADGTGVGTILDNGTGAGGTDNDTPTLSVNSVTVLEGTDAFATFVVSVNRQSTTPVTVNLALANGSATGGDFGPGMEISTDGGGTWTAGTSATIAAGSTSVLVRTQITDDLLHESTETFTLTATRSAGTTTNVAATGTATIVDNDTVPDLTIGDVTVNEATGTASFTVSLSAPSGRPVSVNFATSNGSALAGADYSTVSGTLNFAPGVTSQTITVPILNDAIFENSESFNVTLSAPVNAAIADATGIGTILDNGGGTGGTDNDTPTLAVSDVTVVEGTDPLAVFAVSLSNVSTTPVSFNLSLANGLATGGDYGPGMEISTDGGATWTAGTSGTIAAGSTSVLVRTPITDDALNEAVEDFTLTATVTSGTTLNASVKGTGTIGDDDGDPTVSINDVTVNEAAGTITFTVSLSAPSGQVVTVDYAANDGTATSADYAAGLDALSGTLTFGLGVTSQTITLAITDDAIFEQSEAFTITLSAPVNALVADGTGVGTIRDDGTGIGGTDNDTPTLTVGDAVVTEGTDGFAIFTIGLSNPSTTATQVSVSLLATSGTAIGGGVDFGTTGAGNLQISTDGGVTWVDATTVTIPAGELTVLARMPITNDALDEDAETFSLTAEVSSGTTVNATATGTATIVDDDPDASMSIAVDDLTLNEAAGTMTFTVSLDTPSGRTVSVNYGTVNGTATGGADFTAVSGTLTFAAGVTSRTVTVPILNDAIFENSETFDVVLSGPVNAVFADSIGTGTILDNGFGAGGTDNDTPTLSVTNVAVTEGTDPHAIFAVSVSNLSTAPLTFDLTLSDGSATAADFGPGLEVSTDGGLTWNAGSSATIAPLTTSVLVRTPIMNDALDEAAETFTLTATRTSGTTLNASATGTATIADDDATPSLSIDSVTVNEAAGTATFTVTLSAASGQAITVGFATSDGTAASGADYSVLVGTLNFAPGVTSRTITVPISDDAIFENSENFNVTLSAPVNATIASAVGVGTIRDDGTGLGGTDNDTPTVSVSDVAVVEGTDSHAVFVVALSNQSTTPVNLALALANGSAMGAGVDFGAAVEVSTDGGLTWNAGSSATIAPLTASVLVRTPITNDALDEAAETFTLTATRTSGTTLNASATGTATIADDDATPSLSIDNVTVNEAAGTATFTVTLSAASGQAVSVQFATGNATATAGADYTAGSGTLNFAPGVTSQTVIVAIANDGVFEGSETFNVTLSGATNATIAAPVGTGTILDDGTGPGGTDNDTPSLAVYDVVVTEGTNPHAIFAVSLSNPSTTPVSFNLALANGTATGADYGPALEVSTDGGTTWNAATSATIAPGSMSVLVRTPIVDDALNEVAETFTLTATRTSGTTVNASAAATATINDNDVVPGLSINDVTVNEGAGTITFTITMSAPSGQAVSVNYTTVDGTALAGSDYSAGSNVLNFAPGVVSQTVTLAIANDAVFEGSESFNVILSAAVNATISNASGLGTIRDDGAGFGGTDDDTPTLTVTDVTELEGTDVFAVFAVSLSNASTTPVSVALALNNGSATGADYGPTLEISMNGGATWTSAASVIFAPGSTSVLARTAIVDDALDENTETFTLTATRTAGTTTNGAAVGTSTILDNDNAPLLSIGDVTVNEKAGTMTFTVTLDAPSGLAISVDFAMANGTAGAADYTASSGTLNFAPGVTSHTIVVPVLDDVIFEQREDFAVTLSNPVNAGFADAVAVGRILDDGTGAGGTDNDTPTVSVNNVAVTEGTDAYAVFTVSLTNPSTTPVDFDLALANGSALGGGVDFGAGGAGNLQVSTDGGGTWTNASAATFAPGETSLLVRAPINDDALDENVENFTLTATITGGVTTNAGAVGTATITDNDLPPALSVGDVTVNEGAGTITFTVQLSGASGLAISVDYTMADGTATIADYTGATGTLNFAPGVTSQTITVPVLNDALFEQSEFFVVILANPVKASIADPLGIGTIVDDGSGAGGTDDDTPVLSVSNVGVFEGTDPYAVFTVSLSNPSTTAVSFNLALGNMTALGGGSDFGTSGAGNLQVSTDGGATWADANAATIAPNTLSVLVRTPITSDAANEPTENFTLTATVTSGITTSASAIGTGTIDDIASSIGGRVYIDADDDGNFDAGETGLAGVTITLNGIDDVGVPVIRTTVTDGAGGYNFTNLRPGAYTIAETQPVTYLDGTERAGNLGGTVGDDRFSSVITAAGQTGVGYNFGELEPASLNGTVFRDLNNDGVLDSGEVGIEGVTITVTGTNDLGVITPISVITDTAGNYTISNLRPGTYTITETQPAEYSDGIDTVGTSGGVAGNDVLSGISFVAGTTATQYNFGERGATLSGTVFRDSDKDATLGVGEIGVAGVSLQLLDGGGSLVATTTTALDGTYRFTDLPAGSYTVVETQPNGYGSSTANVRAVNITTSGIAGVDFGETTSSLSGRVFLDGNQDGGFTAGESGIGGTMVTLSGTDADGNAVSLTTTTATDGTYTFTDLLAGDYALTEAQPAQFDDGADSVGTMGGSLVSPDAIGSIPLLAGSDGAGYNFGENGLAISGTIFIDSNKDGVRNETGTGLGGVSVLLLDTNGLLVAVASTAADGTYSFTNLAAGDYTVTETQPAGYGSSTSNSVPVTLFTGSIAAAVDFGDTTGSIAGTIYHDLNNDGVIDSGESMVQGTQVTLTGTDVNGNAVSLTTLSQADGSYRFSGLLSGTYQIAETQPAGFRDGRETVGSAGGDASINDTISSVSIAGGSDESGYQFGERTGSDLVIRKSDGRSTVRPGDVVRYTITIRNVAPQDADGVLVTDRFPTELLEFVSASNGGVFDAATGTIRWNLGVLAGSGAQTLSLNITARVKAEIPAGVETVANFVTAVDRSSPGTDLRPGNNTARDVDQLLAAPDLYILKTDNLTTTTVGDAVNYTISGGNAGDQAAGGVIIRDTLPRGVKFVSASNGGRLVNGEIVWNLGTLRPGETFQLSVKVVVEQVPAGGQLMNSATIEDEFGSTEDPARENNRAFDLTSVKPLFVPPRDGFTFAYDVFNNAGTHPREGIYEPSEEPEIYRRPILPLAPVYSGEADPGATLFVSLVNARGVTIGEQTIMVDVGGNWLVTFPSSTLRDAPSSVRITQVPAPYSIVDGAGYNLRTYFSPALNPGHFFTESQTCALLNGRPTPLLSGLGLENPLQLGSVKYGGELLGSQATASGY